MNQFTINIDYETSERVGAGGMFQVAGIWDNDAKDVTEALVDVGKHDASLDEVKRDIAQKVNLVLSDILIDVT